MSKSKQKSKLEKPLKSSELPTSLGYVNEVRQSLRFDTTSLRREMEARLKEIEIKFQQPEYRSDKIDRVLNKIDTRLDSIDARLDKMDLRFDMLDSKYEEIRSMFHKGLASMEEQNIRNKFLFDNYAPIYDVIKALAAPNQWST